ncbi:hypothetical protein QE197_00725 [Arsenophonus nasoniae]|uniref:Bacterial type III secretion apparatus protein (OrgA_MxiK) n=2 Tax=Arsenophonus nasoniae TaxID=638 RepID=A0A4P7KWH4_9GAMM|nr:hypothetical protein [Arsenophonus nasoniae]QBY41768.1 Bacterial type III secretion apparatus protein (OrgA_MxiK) [Arsenophonus nasoniae]WGM05947.1 hypothetical protein QE258_00735 [Arsenophonus nasoniae]WGM10958.1 hypothetical protein QE197_00725 [Arsenophonus nasoniae]
MKQQTFNLIKTIMYQPASSIHHSFGYPPYDKLTMAEKRIYDQQVMVRFQLPTALDFELDDNLHAQLYINYWSRLPIAALYLGGLYQSPQLMIANQLTQLPEQFSQFLSWARLLLPPQKKQIVPLIATSYSQDELTKCGMWAIIPLIEKCSLALTARFSLLFNKNYPQCQANTVLPVNYSLLKATLNYVTYTT